jgi:hypothetical protein
MTDLVDAPQQATDFGRDLVRQSPMLVVQFFQIKTELLVEFVRSRGNEFVDKVIERSASTTKPALRSWSASASITAGNSSGPANFVCLKGHIVGISCGAR